MLYLEGFLDLLDLLPGGLCLDGQGGAAGEEEGEEGGGKLEEGLVEDAFGWWGGGRRRRTSCGWEMEGGGWDGR